MKLGFWIICFSGFKTKFEDCKWKKKRFPK